MTNRCRRSSIIIFVFVIICILSTKPILRTVYPRKYSDLVEESSQKYGVPSEIIYAVIKTESNFDPHAVSPRGAIGLMQIMPSTFDWLTGLTGEHLDASALYDPAVNVRYGTFFLKYLYDHYGNYNTAFAAYNAGMGNVSKWLLSEEFSQNGLLVAIPFSETASYIRLVSDRAIKYQKIYK